MWDVGWASELYAEAEEDLSKKTERDRSLGSWEIASYILKNLWHVLLSLTLCSCTTCNTWLALPMQHTAAYCSTATHCNTLQHTYLGAAASEHYFNTWLALPHYLLASPYYNATSSRTQAHVTRTRSLAHAPFEKRWIFSSKSEAETKNKKGKRNGRGGRCVPKPWQHVAVHCAALHLAGTRFPCTSFLALLKWGRPAHPAPDKICNTYATRRALFNPMHGAFERLPVGLQRLLVACWSTKVVCWSIKGCLLVC